MNNKKFGFTLAEVLITLAIIGVVAALTLPTLLANYEKKEWTTRLIKTHAELTQAFKLMMAKENSSTLSETNAWSTVPDNGCKSTNWQNGTHTLLDEGCRGFREGLLSAISGSVNSFPNINYRIIDLQGNIYFEDNENLKLIKLNNNAILLEPSFFQKARIVNYQDGNFITKIGSFYVDVNGVKGPNKLGRDIFRFAVSDSGILYPQGGKEFSILANGDDSLTWDKSTNSGYNCINLKTISGHGCTARVLEEGKMNY